MQVYSIAMNINDKALMVHWKCHIIILRLRWWHDKAKNIPWWIPRLILNEAMIYVHIVKIKKPRGIHDEAKMKPRMNPLWVCEEAEMIPWRTHEETKKNPWWSWGESMMKSKWIHEIMYRNRISWHHEYAIRCFHSYMMTRYDAIILPSWR